MKRVALQTTNTKYGVIYEARKVSKTRKLLIAVFFVLVLVLAETAGAGTATNMPWEGPLNLISDSLSGPVTKALCLIMVVVSVGVLIFGGDLSGWARSVTFMALAAGILGSAATFIGLLGVTGALI